MKRGFAPIISKETKVLILGSFPGEASLQKQQYYGHPKNQFWQLIEMITKESIHEKEYLEKIEKLHKHKIGLWDIYASCKRKGSLDLNISKAKHNELQELLQEYTNIQLICFNGKTAAKKEQEMKELKKATLILPSSSPAHTMPFKEKAKVWQQIQEYL